MGAVFLAGFVAMFAVVSAAANALLGAGPSLSEESYWADPITQLAANGEAGLGLAAEPVARRQIEYPRGHAHINVTSATVTLSGSKGINSVQRSTTDNSVYCFDLTFAPRVAVASANINNNAAVGTVLGNSVPSGCLDGFKDAAKTYGANDSLPHSDINFGIVFIWGDLHPNRRGAGYSARVRLFLLAPRVSGNVRSRGYGARRRSPPS